MFIFIYVIYVSFCFTLQYLSFVHCCFTWFNLASYFHNSNMGSRALSHDSIFLADLCLSSTEPPRVLSQENVQSRIKTLQVSASHNVALDMYCTNTRGLMGIPVVRQMKLQQQNLRLGHPPLVMSIKRPEDASGSSEDDGLPQSPPEIVLNGVLPQRASYKVTATPFNYMEKAFS